MGRSEEQLRGLVERLVELRQEKRYLEGEIERVSSEVAEALGEGAKRAFGDIQVRVSVARPGLRIVRAAEVPPEFQTKQPDRKLILSHFNTTGEMPPGVEATLGRPIVYAKGPGSADDDADEA